MLTADLVNARRRGDELFVSAIARDKRARAEEIAGDLIELFASSDGRTRDEVLSDIAALEVEAREQRLKDGLLKLLDDRSTWGLENALDPEEVRRALFGRATERRLALGPGERFDRGAVIAEVARDRGTTAELLEAALFADLRGANVLSGFEPLSAAQLVDAYERGQAQAVLLRAVRVVVDVRCASPGAARALFRRLKFLGLLHTVVPRDKSYEVTIDGPMSLFDSVTKYGHKLAQLLPLLEGCEAWKLAADIKWGKERRPLKFRVEKGEGRGSADPSLREEPPMPDDLAALVRTFGQLQSDWKVSPGRVVLDLPGVGLSVPDLIFQRGSDKVYLEALGYWSREAVFRRVDLVRQGLSAKIVFAVSSRLRVSEELLDEDASGALYVYKGTMSARTILSHLDRLSQR